MFADIARTPKTSVISIKTGEEGNAWLLRYIIGKLPLLRSVESLREVFLFEGVSDIQIRAMRGKPVVLSFSTFEQMKSMLEGGGGLAWLYNWFDEDS